MGLYEAGSALTDLAKTWMDMNAQHQAAQQHSEQMAHLQQLVDLQRAQLQHTIGQSGIENKIKLIGALANSDDPTQLAPVIDALGGLKNFTGDDNASQLAGNFSGSPKFEVSPFNSDANTPNQNPTSPQGSTSLTDLFKQAGIQPGSKKVNTATAIAGVHQGFSNAKMSPQDEQEYTGLQSALGNIQSLPDSIPDDYKFTLAAGLSKHGELGKIIGSFVDPRVQPYAEAVASTGLKEAAGMKGRMGPQMVQIVAPTLPDIAVNSKNWPQVKAQTAARLRMYDYIQRSYLDDKGVTQNQMPDGPKLIDPQTKATFKNWQQFLQHPGMTRELALKSPSFVNWTNQLGLNDLFNQIQ